MVKNISGLILIQALFLFLRPAMADILLDKAEEAYRRADYPQAFDYYHLAAQKGDPQAQAALGLLYEKGQGTPKDYREALKWFQKAARKGDPEAQNNLGFLYFKGLGAKTDESEAFHWFEKSALQGLASAQANLGLLYGQGLGVKKDYEKAFGWFKRAAEQNDLDGQINLAQMLSLGEGTAKDYVESHKWFSLAIKHHAHTDGELAELRNDIEWLEKRMKGREIDEAHRQADAWKAVDERQAEKGPAGNNGGPGNVTER